MSHSRHTFQYMFVLLLASLVAMPLGAVAGEIYRWKDANGVTHYSDSKAAAEHAERVTVQESSAFGGSSVESPAARSQPATSHAAVAQPDILMYDNPACGYCRKAERWFNQHGLAYRKVDITANAGNKEAFMRAGGRGTPLILVDGVAVRGFNEARLQRLVFGR